jgi:hypothetical protein
MRGAVRWRVMNVKVAVALLVALLYDAVGIALLTTDDRRGRIGFVFIFLSLYAFYHACSAWGKNVAPVQFSLRTLLIVMTLLAMLLGAVVYMWR